MQRQRARQVACHLWEILPPTEIHEMNRIFPFPAVCLGFETRRYRLKGTLCVQCELVQEGTASADRTARAANFRRDLKATYRTLIDGYLESPFPTACLL